MDLYLSARDKANPNAISFGYHERNNKLKWFTWLLEEKVAVYCLFY